MEDYDIDYDDHCPHCGHTPLHSRTCINWCDDGSIEVFFDDIEIEGMGDVQKCPECKGTGIERWCPNCGENLSGKCGQNEDDDL